MTDKRCFKCGSNSVILDGNKWVCSNHLSVPKHKKQDSIDREYDFRGLTVEDMERDSLPLEGELINRTSRVINLRLEDLFYPTEEEKGRIRASFDENGEPIKGLNRHRKAHRLGDVVLSDGQDHSDESLQSQGRKNPSPAEMLMRQSLKVLTSRQRIVWEMWNYDRLTHDEIAVKLNVARQVIQRTIRAAENRMRKWVEAHMEVYKALSEEYKSEAMDE